MPQIKGSGPSRLGRSNEFQPISGALAKNREDYFLDATHAADYIFSRIGDSDPSVGAGPRVLPSSPQQLIDPARAFEFSAAYARRLPASVFFSVEWCDGLPFPWATTYQTKNDRPMLERAWRARRSRGVSKLWVRDFTLAI